MRNKFLCIAVVCFLAPLSLAEQPAKPAAPIAYALPEEVYKVYREACLKRDWRTVWNCFTMERQKYELFECYFASETKPDTPQLRATLKKHGLELEQVNAEAVRVYENAHRVKYTPNTKIETELLYEVIFNLVADKPGFYEEMCNHIIELGPMKIAELKNVTLQANTATGQSTTTLTGLATRPGQPERKFKQIVPTEIRFAKINGGWLIGP